jgi:hypothetical protein
VRLTYQWNLINNERQELLNQFEKQFYVSHPEESYGQQRVDLLKGLFFLYRNHPIRRKVREFILKFPFMLFSHNTKKYQNKLEVFLSAYTKADKEPEIPLLVNIPLMKDKKNGKIEEMTPPDPEEETDEEMDEDEELQEKDHDDQNEEEEQYEDEEYDEEDFNFGNEELAGLQEEEEEGEREGDDDEEYIDENATSDEEDDEGGEEGSADALEYLREYQKLAEERGDDLDEFEVEKEQLGNGETARVKDSHDDDLLQLERRIGALVKKGIRSVHEEKDRLKKGKSDEEKETENLLVGQENQENQEKEEEVVTESPKKTKKQREIDEMTPEERQRAGAHHLLEEYREEHPTGKLKKPKPIHDHRKQDQLKEKEKKELKEEIKLEKKKEKQKEELETREHEKEHHKKGGKKPSKYEKYSDAKEYHGRKPHPLDTHPGNFASLHMQERNQLKNRRKTFNYRTPRRGPPRATP